MKKVIFLLIGIIILTGCHKNDDKPFVPGEIISNINYVGSNKKSVDKIINTHLKDTVYSQFGTFITSLTPAVFKAKFITIRFVDEITSVVNQMELINNNLPYTDPLRYADFTNNSSVSMNPELGGHLANEGASFSETVVFKYFYFRLEYFRQKLNLPVQYASIDSLDQFHFSSDSSDATQTAGSLTNNVLDVKYRPLLLPLFPGVQLQRLPDAFVFGGTDSTYVLDLLNGPPELQISVPHDGDYIVRSNLYNILTFTPPPDQSKTTYINTTMTFNYNNLIQVYAGLDNIPYTKDDIFVYAPNFWERLSINVTFEHN